MPSRSQSNRGGRLPDLVLSKIGKDGSARAVLREEGGSPGFTKSDAKGGASRRALLKISAAAPARAKERANKTRPNWTESETDKHKPERARSSTKHVESRWPGLLSANMGSKGVRSNVSTRVPIQHTPKNKNVKPMRERHRKSSELAVFSWSRMDADTPARHMPSMGRVESGLTRLCTNGGGPRRLTSGTSGRKPNLPCPQGDDMGAARTKLRIGIAEPMQVWCSAEAAKPSCAEARGDVEDPILTVSSEKGEGPIRTRPMAGTESSRRPKLCAGAKRPRCVQSEAEVRSSGRDMPEANAMDPRLAKLWVDGVLPKCRKSGTGSSKPKRPRPQANTVEPALATPRINKQLPK